MSLSSPSKTSTKEWDYAIDLEDRKKNTPLILQSPQRPTTTVAATPTSMAATTTTKLSSARRLFG
jgi:hypothetical protein